MIIMPELPDVEVYRRYINSNCLNKKIKNVKVKNTKVLENISKKKLEEKLKDNKFIDTYRKGKYLFIKTDNDFWLVLHFGMTGDVKYFKNIDDEPSHSRLLLYFYNDYYLSFDNQRMLGKINLIYDKDKYIGDKNLGIDALELDFKGFLEIVKDRHSMIKSTLMNQKLICGIGNIYADEILFQSKIYPKIKTDKLSKNKLKLIYNNINGVLNKAIDVKADADKFPDNFIIPNRDKDGVCPKDGIKLETVKVNNRTSYFCPKHQKKK